MFVLDRPSIPLARISKSEAGGMVSPRVDALRGVFAVNQGERRSTAWKLFPMDTTGWGVAWDWCPALVYHSATGESHSLRRSFSAPSLGRFQRR